MVPGISLQIGNCENNMAASNKIEILHICFFAVTLEFCIGFEKRTCQGAGVWSPEAPVCQVPQIYIFFSKNLLKNPLYECF